MKKANPSVIKIIPPTISCFHANISAAIIIAGFISFVAKENIFSPKVNVGLLKTPAAIKINTKANTMAINRGL